MALNDTNTAVRRDFNLTFWFQHVHTSVLFEGTSVSETCATQNAKLVEDKRKKAGTAQKAGAFYIIL